MDRKLVWIAIFVVLALTAVTVVNCRRLPDPWEPTAGPAARTAPIAQSINVA